MATIDVRKLQYPGKTSRSVAIPRGWTDYYGLRKGDDVYVITNEQFVLICPTNVDVDKVRRIFLEMCQKYYSVEHVVETKTEKPETSEVSASTSSAVSPVS